MGLAFFSPSPRTLSLVRAVAANVERSLDDQVSLNRLLRSRGIAALSAASGDDHMAALMGRADDGLRVAFISTAVVLRDCDAHRRADVPPLTMHCLTKKTAQSKERDMRQRGLWLLGD